MSHRVIEAVVIQKPIFCIFCLISESIKLKKSWRQRRQELVTSSSGKNSYLKGFNTVFRIIATIFKYWDLPDIK